MTRHHTASLLVAITVTAALTAGCTQPAPVDPGPTAAEIATAKTVATMNAAFPDVNINDPAEVLATAHDNFGTQRIVQVRAHASDGSHDVPADVRLSPQGVYAKSWLSGQFAETIVVNGHDGYLRGPAKFWVANGLQRSAAKKAAGQWVRTSAVAEKDQTMPAVRRRLTTEFTKEWGTATGDVTLTEFRDAPAMRVETAYGYVLAAGEPLLPVKYVFTRDTTTSAMAFAYRRDGVKPVNIPDRSVTLDALVR